MLGKTWAVVYSFLWSIVYGMIVSIILALVIYMIMASGFNKMNNNINDIKGSNDVSRAINDTANDTTKIVMLTVFASLVAGITQIYLTYGKAYQYGLVDCPEASKIAP